jgi:hypothetical protein
VLERKSQKSYSDPAFLDGRRISDHIHIENLMISGHDSLQPGLGLGQPSSRSLP